MSCGRTAPARSEVAEGARIRTRSDEKRGNEKRQDQTKREAIGCHETRRDEMIQDEMR
jgi:hypothetical protein